MVLSNKPGVYEMGMPDDDQHTLTLLKVKASDVGVMACIASNKHGNDTCNFPVELAGEQTQPSVSLDNTVVCVDMWRFRQISNILHMCGKGAGVYLYLLGLEPFDSNQ